MPLIRKDASPPPAAPTDAFAALTSSKSEYRWSAARQLAKDPKNARLLGSALASETDPRVREALFTSLAHIQTAEAVEAILPHLRSDDAAIRAGALDALNAMPAAAESYIYKLLGDPDSDVRLLACDVVRRLPGPVANRHLCELLEREILPNVCGAAVEALSEVGDATALPVLQRCAERFAAEEFLLFSIRIASDRIGGEARSSGPRAS